MDQAVVWLQLVLWTLFALATVGCGLSVVERWRAELYAVVINELIVWGMMLFAWIFLHHAIRFFLAS